MGALDKLRKGPLGRLLGRPSSSEDEPGSPTLDESAPELLEAQDLEGVEGRRGLTGWVEARAHRVMSKVYESRADDVEQRARRIVSSAYQDKADDLEDRAVRAMRRAIQLESERIQSLIEHSVRVKRREVRLSLFVLVVAALVYLALYWFTNRPA